MQSSQCCKQTFWLANKFLKFLLGDIQKVPSVKISKFWPPPPLFALVRFRA